MNIKQINNVDVEITENQFINTSKGIVYVYDYNLVRFELFKSGFEDDKLIKNEVATWITP